MIDLDVLGERRSLFRKIFKKTAKNPKNFAQTTCNLQKIFYPDTRTYVEKEEEVGSKTKIWINKFRSPRLSQPGRKTIPLSDQPVWEINEIGESI